VGYGGRNRLYKFDMDELADLLRISFPLYHNCAIAGQPIKAHKLLSFITESYDNEIGGLRLKDIKDIIKVNYKKNDIIDIEQAFNIFKLLLQKNWDLDPNQSDICTRQILCVFGSRVGYLLNHILSASIFKFSRRKISRFINSGNCNFLFNRLVHALLLPE
jgi:hypothetical protein